MQYFKLPKSVCIQLKLNTGSSWHKNSCYHLCLALTLLKDAKKKMAAAYAWQHDHSCIVLVLLKEIISLKNLWNALHYDTTIVFARDSESQLFESQERPAVHAAAWKHTGFYSKSLPNSINPFLLEQPNVKIGMKKIIMMRRVSDIAIYCKTIGTLWLSVWANEYAGQSMWEKYPLKN